MKLTITGNNMVSNGKQLHGIVINDHVLLPSNEDFVIFDNEEQKKNVLQVINQYSNIKLKYNNALLRSEADAINDNTTFIINGTEYNIYEAVIYITERNHNINDNNYTVDLKFLKFFKNINSLYIHINIGTPIMIIDCTNIITIEYIHNHVLLLNTHNIKHIKYCGYTTITNKALKFPVLETIDEYAFNNVLANNIVDLGKITYIPRTCFYGVTINKLILPPTCHTIMCNAFDNATINKLVTDYVKKLKIHAFYNSNIISLSFPNLELFDKDDTNEEEEYKACISYCDKLQEIKSLGKITVLPKFSITSITKLIYLDIPITLKELHTSCLVNLGYNKALILNTLDFSNVTTIEAGAISNIYADTIIFPTTFNGSANFNTISNNFYANKIINFNTGNISNRNTELTITNLNNYNDVPDTSILLFNGISSIDEYLLSFSCYEYDNGTISETYNIPAYKVAITSITSKKLTVNTPYINAIKNLMIYEDLILPDNIEYIAGVTFYGDHFNFPANLKYISQCSFSNLKTVSYPSSLLLKAAWYGLYNTNTNIALTKPINFLLPCEFFAYNAITLNIFIEEPIIRVPEGLKKTYGGGFYISSRTCTEIILPSTLTHLTLGVANVPNIQTLTVLSENFTLDQFNINTPILHLNIDNCKKLCIGTNYLQLKTEIIEFPESLELIFSMPSLNVYSCLKKIIFHGTTELRGYNAVSFAGNPTTIKEIINVHIAFVNMCGAVLDMSNLEKITFADNLPNSTTLSNALRFKKKLREVRLPNTLVTINSEALKGTAISEIDIPETIEFISNTAFKMCSNLRTMIVRATTPPTSEKADKKRVSNLCTIYVPAESLQLYKESPYWRIHFNLIESIEGEELEAANQVYYTIKRNNITL